MRRAKPTSSASSEPSAGFDDPDHRCRLGAAWAHLRDRKEILSGL
jgi:hypothetical protein